MKYRIKSKIKGKWAFVKFKRNLAIYAVCQNCGFTYECSKRDEISKNPFKQIPNTPYKYCPNCGLKMSLFNNNHVYLNESEE